jgi:putative hydrolase of the HAD superfamily
VPPPTPYRALIVDYGGVLTTPLQDAMVGFAGEIGIELQDFVRAALGVYAGQEDELVSGFETGAISEDEFARAFAERLSRATGEEIEPRGLVTRIFAGLRLEPPMLAAVAEVKSAGLKTALLSNSWGTSLYPRASLADLFDVMVISGEVGLRKPDPEIFKLVTERLDVAPQACVFVDDTPEHLKSARELGITTLLHRTSAQTMAELEALLGLPLSETQPSAEPSTDSS